ncbi:MAG: hypothetical protein Fur0037_05650 [Planctomycetota bacterium]
MSLRELSERLGTSLRFTASLLRRLEKGLRERRAKWISARPSDVEEPVLALERLAAEVAEARRSQQELLRAIAVLLPRGAVREGVPMRVNATRIAAALPPADAARLRASADEAAAAASAVRVEVGLGDRLVRFSRMAHEAFVQRLVTRTNPLTCGVRGYDRRALAVQGGLLAGAGPTGALVDGKS